ncbi:hypothetical protein FFI71_002495 [Bradyrhizobium sp. KBS0725]|nr:hypothetical protein FFI71_002495 [Bradyrhizobium sp. KBS0725]
MNRLFDVFHDKFSGSMPVGSQHGPMMPGIDVSETDQELRISADLPGVNEDETSVSPLSFSYSLFAAVTLPKCKDNEISRKIPVQCGPSPGSPLPSGQAPPRKIESSPDSNPDR